MWTLQTTKIIISVRFEKKVFFFRANKVLIAFFFSCCVNELRTKKRHLQKSIEHNLARKIVEDLFQVRRKNDLSNNQKIKSRN